MAVGQTKALPYDARVEYIASDGNQYIDTGIECTGDLSVEFRAYWTNTNNTAICGGIINTGGTTYFRHHMSPRYSSAQSLYWYQHDSASGPSISGRAGSPNYWHTFKLDADTGDWDLDSGALSGTVSPLSGTLTTGKSWGIMARISSDGSLQAKPSRWDWCKLSRGGVLLRDYIAVRVGTTGYLYDRVSGQFFGNDGSGNFTVGPDAP